MNREPRMRMRTRAWRALYRVAMALHVASHRLVHWTEQHAYDAALEDARLAASFTGDPRTVVDGDYDA